MIQESANFDALRQHTQPPIRRTQQALPARIRRQERRPKRHLYRIPTSLPMMSRIAAHERAAMSGRSSVPLPDVGTSTDRAGAWSSAHAGRRGAGCVCRLHPSLFLGRPPRYPVCSVVPCQPPGPSGRRTGGQHRRRVRVHSGGGHGCGVPVHRHHRTKLTDDAACHDHNRDGEHGRGDDQRASPVAHSLVEPGRVLHQCRTGPAVPCQWIAQDTAQRFGEEGTALAELVIVAPLLLLVALLMIFFGRIESAQGDVEAAARAGVEAAVVQSNAALASNHRR